MISPAEAERLMRKHLPEFGSESCPLGDAQGRVLRQDLRGDRDLPPFDRVMVDGYALRAAKLTGRHRTFRISGTQAAGMRPFQLAAAGRECIEVATGAVLPVGADWVVAYEDTTAENGIMTVQASVGKPRKGDGVHRQGSDHRKGTVIVRAGVALTGREIAVAAAVGAARVVVAQRPKIAVVATGDELVEVGDAVAPHQIRRSNDAAVRAALIQAGYPGVERFHLHDMRHEIEHMLWHIIAEFDVILVIGGVSKGKFDFLPAELDAQGVKKVFQGVAQRPGRPMWFGVNPDGKPVFALPGNPVSAYICLHRYVLPALAQSSGRVERPREMVRLAKPVTFHSRMTYFLPVRLVTGADGERQAVPDPSNTSGDFAGLVGTDGFVELPPGPVELPAGQAVPFWPWT